MTYEELKVDTIYTTDSKEYKVLHKHDESKTAFLLDVEANKTSHWSKEELLFLEQRLPETGLMVFSDTDAIYYRTGGQSGYGFNSLGNFLLSNNFLSFNLRPRAWREATKEDHTRFKDLVVEHLKGLGFKDGDSFYSLVRGYVMTFNFEGNIEFDGGGIYLGGRIVFDGKTWIQPISAKETEKEKLKSLLNQMKELIDSM